MRFLFITKEYPPTPDPSGQIVYSIAEELKKRGHYVHIIARDDKWHYENGYLGNIYWLEKSCWEKISKKIKSGSCSRKDVLTHKFLTYARKVVLAFRLDKFPDSEFSITKRIVAVYEQYLKTEKIDYVVGFFRPYSCLSAAMIIKKKNTQLKCISCYFDLVEPKSRPSFMPKIIYNRLLKKGDLKVIQESNCIMLPVSAKRRNELIFNECSNVIYYEFPTFVSNNDVNADVETVESINTTEIKLVFAGTMTRSYRSPEMMIKVINAVAKQLNEYRICLDVFGGGDCADMFVSCSQFDNLTINYHGIVSKDEVSLYEKKANLLINIMNDYEAIVPSKIFGLFATGKPILNLCTNSDDGSLKYFEKYPLSYTVHQHETQEKQKIKEINFVCDFILNNYKRYLSYEKVEVLFKECTPSYVVNQILDACNDKFE